MLTRHRPSVRCQNEVSPLTSKDPRPLSQIRSLKLSVSPSATDSVLVSAVPSPFSCPSDLWSGAVTAIKNLRALYYFLILISGASERPVSGAMRRSLVMRRVPEDSGRFITWAAGGAAHLPRPWDPPPSGSAWTQDALELS